MAVELAVLAFLCCLSAFFSGAETILFSLTDAQRARIRARDPRADELIARMVGDSAMLLSTLIVGNTLVNFAIATLGYEIFVWAFPRWGGFASVPAMTLFLLIFGEITPKRIALRHAESLAPACARLLLFWRMLLTPFNLAFRFSSRAFSTKLDRERRALSDAELVSVLETAAENGDFAADDAEMIGGILRLSETHANDEMTPRVDIEGIDITLDPLPAGRQPPADSHQPPAASHRTSGHTLLPVYRRSPDFIEGIFDSRTGRMSEALFVPEQVTLDDLLVTLHKSGRRMAVVTDEFGGTAGIITLNDIMELVLGPAVFGGQDDEPKMTCESRRTWIIDGDVSLDEINNKLGLELEAGDFDRLSGWVQYHAERIPHVGQEIEAQGCRATIVKRRKRRVTQVRLEVLEMPEADSDEELLAETDEAVEKTEEDNE